MKKLYVGSCDLTIPDWAVYFTRDQTGVFMVWEMAPQVENGVYFASDPDSKFEQVSHKLLLMEI